MILRPSNIEEEAPSIGNRPSQEAERLLMAAGDPYGAEMKRLSHGRGAFPLFKKEPPPYLGEHVCGFLGKVSHDGALGHAVSAKPDPTLIGQRVRISLSRLYVHKYPGNGPHNILFRFRLVDRSENASPEFMITKRAQDQEHLGAQNVTIFEGQIIEARGLSIHCKTVNISNDDDRKLLDLFDDPAFSKGLQLLLTNQPVLAPFTALTAGLFKFFLRRHENVVVQDFEFGLTFGDDPMSLKLAEGNYVIAQVPRNKVDEFKIDSIRFDPHSGALIDSVTDKRLSVNYLVLGISRISD